MNENTALIIGATSSLATVFCRQLAEQGWSLILTGRNKVELNIISSDLRIRYNVNCRIIVVDLNSKKFEPKNIIAQASPFNNIFVFSGVMETNNQKYTVQDINNIIKVNFLSIIQIIEISISELQKYKNSKIMIISSVAGDRGRKSNYIYGSAKAGINHYCSGLRNRLNNSRIHVMTVKLGFVDTSMTFNLNSKLIVKRSYISKKILLALKLNKNVIYLPFFWSYIMLIIKMIPENVFKRLNL
jgi:decaprenylphospho-beta-D-erythro-pentofuranosid-2-ulose 2-reductase